MAAAAVPVEDRAEPPHLAVLDPAALGSAVATHRLGIFAEVDAGERRDPRDDLVLQEPVVVRPGGLDRAAAPPAAALRHRPRHALERRVGQHRRHRLHSHRLVDLRPRPRHRARPRLVGESVVPLLAAALRARRVDPPAVVVLIARGERLVAAALPHALREERRDVRETRVGRRRRRARALAEVEDTVAVDLVEVPDGLAESLPGVHRVRVAEADLAPQLRPPEHLVDRRVARAHRGRRWHGARLAPQPVAASDELAAAIERVGPAGAVIGLFRPLPPVRRDAIGRRRRRPHRRRPPAVSVGLLPALRWARRGVERGGERDHRAIAHEVVARPRPRRASRGASRDELGASQAQSLPLASQ